MSDTNALADVAEPTIRYTRLDDMGNVVVQTHSNQYVFSSLRADKIRGGQKVDVEGSVVYTGSTKANHYPAESSLDEVPEKVIDEAADRAVVVDNIESGWSSWDGRPEFSTSYVDIADVEIVAGA